MVIALWIVGSILALLYIFAGFTKALSGREKLLKQMPYTEDFQPWQVKVIGVLEILGGLGIVLPLVTGIAPILAPIAALALAVVQIFAGIVHIRRKETFVPSIVLFAVALFVGVGWLVVGV